MEFPRQFLIFISRREISILDDIYIHATYYHYLICLIDIY